MHIFLFPRNIYLLLQTRLTACLTQIRYDLSLHPDMISSVNACLSRKLFPQLLTSCLGLMPNLGICKHHELFKTHTHTHKTRHNKTRRKHLYQGWTKQPNRRKRVSRAVKSQRYDQFHSEKSQIDTKQEAIIYTEELVKTHAGSYLLVQSQLGSCEPCLVDMLVHVLLMVLILYKTYYSLLSLFFLPGYPISEGKDLVEICNLDLVSA